MFEQATIPIQDEKTFAEVKKAIDEAFAASTVASFLRRIEGAKLRVRQFEAVPGSRNSSAPRRKKVMPPSGCRPRPDSRAVPAPVERVAPEIRQKFSGSTRATKGRNRLWLLRISKSSRAGCLHGPMSGCGRGCHPVRASSAFRCR